MNYIIHFYISFAQNLIIFIKRTPSPTQVASTKYELGWGTFYYLQPKADSYREQYSSSTAALMPVGFILKNIIYI